MIWILLTLASNSMAQPSGRISGASSRYRIYLCSSPFFCLADGLAISLRVLVTSMHLRISPVKASRLAMLSRADERHDSLRNKDTCFDDSPVTPTKEGPPPATAAAWPRWLFFLVGTVPAAIQLASFSGVPVAQALGLMFVLSFTVIELVAFLSTFEEPNTIAEVLGYLKDEGVTIEEEALRFKTYRLMVRLEWCDTILFVTAIFAQAAMMFQLFHQLWAPATVHLSKLLENSIVELIMTIFNTLWLLVSAIFIVRIVLYFTGIWQSLDRWFSLQWTLQRFFWYWCAITYSSVLLPRKPLSQGFRDKALTFIGVCMIAYAFHWVMTRLCERCPAVARALLIDRRPWDAEKIEHLPPQHRTGFEEMTGVIQPHAWSSFCVFLSNSVVCVLWYAFVYDSTGTLNPSWTNVFG